MLAPMAAGLLLNTQWGVLKQSCAMAPRARKLKRIKLTRPNRTVHVNSRAGSHVSHMIVTLRFTMASPVVLLLVADGLTKRSARQGKGRQVSKENAVQTPLDDAEFTESLLDNGSRAREQSKQDVHFLSKDAHLPNLEPCAARRLRFLP